MVNYKGYTKDFLLENQHKEEVLTEENDRFVILPINEKYKDIWDLYKKHEAAFWKAEEIDYIADLKDWDKMSDNERHFIEYILAFFAGSDGIVLENLLTNFGSEVKISEVRAFYGFQTMIENVHGLCYAKLLESLVKDEKKKKKLFNAIEEIEAVKQKAEWALKWINNDMPFAIRLFAFALVEGVFFSGSFCAIFWLKENNKMVKALGHSNELISRDEGMHCDMAVLLFKKLKYKPEASILYNISKEAVEIEKKFICEAIPCDMIGMNKELMSNYIEFVTDRLLQQIGVDKLFYTENPFDFVQKIGMSSKTNFFEKKISEYQLKSTHGITQEAFDLDGDF